MVRVIDKVSDVCFAIDVEGRAGLHMDLIGKLKKLFVEGGYRVYLEYPIWFESRVRKSGDIVRKEGYVDLVAVKNGRKVAVEFDNGVHVKFKSVEKLFQVDADVCIGIVMGKTNGFNGNVERIEEVKKDCGDKNNLWLIVLSEGIAERV